MKVGLEDLIQQLTGGGGGMGGGPGMGGMGSMGMPPQPPQAGPMGQPEIPTGGGSEMSSQINTIATQLTHIGAQLISQGMHDAGISCSKAVKELQKVPQLIQEHQQANQPPPNMGQGGMSMGSPGGMNLGPPGMMPGMG